MSSLIPGGSAELAIAALLSATPAARGRVGIDLSHGESSNRLTVAFSDCNPVPSIGQQVHALDVAHRLIALAEVVGIDEQQRVVRIAVDWPTLRAVEFTLPDPGTA